MDVDAFLPEDDDSAAEMEGPELPTTATAGKRDGAGTSVVETNLIPIPLLTLDQHRLIPLTNGGGLTRNRFRQRQSRAPSRSRSPRPL